MKREQEELEETEEIEAEEGRSAPADAALRRRDDGFAPT
jgi:hypothetical protein